MPVVSVIMVFHRDTRFLRPAITSVLTQTFSDFELVLVDNGTGLTSTELGTAGEDERLRWVRLVNNQGIAAGHNAGVAAARGEFIALLDYDDLAMPTRLEKQVAALRADPGLGLVSSLAKRIDAEGRVTGTVFCILDSAGHRAYAQYAAPVITPAATGRRELFLATPYRPLFPFAADLDFQARASEKWRFAVLPEILLHYRWYADQTTQQKLAAIECSRGAICLTTARRRAGRPENPEAVIRAGDALDLAEYSRQVTKQCLTEGYWELAAYRARRSFAIDCSLASAAKATRLAAQSWLRAPAQERGRIARMFFTGPVRALGLRPA
jgi:hypothetical protein